MGCFKMKQKCEPKKIASAAYFLVTLYWGFTAVGSAGNFAVRIRYAGRISTDLYDIRHFIMVSRPDSRSEQAFGRIGEKGLSAADTDRLVLFPLLHIL